MTGSRFITAPLLPKSDVSLCCVSCEATEVIAALRQRGITVLEMPRSERLPYPIASHADVQLLPLGGNRLLLNEEHAALKEQLQQLGFDVQPVGGLTNLYPNDCRLNCLPVGNKLFCNTKAVWPPLLQQYEAVSVNQGYTRCSALLLAEDALVTDDPSIAAAARLEGVLSGYFPQCEVALKGYDHGFLGGCCGLLNSREVAVCGNGREDGFFPHFKA
ncbi:MAG: hypothetical protein IKV55_04665, partial [Oscillospiraceae bacterium]|nr:hypothetical protein [Oscillospiraceae bacterium]